MPPPKGRRRKKGKGKRKGGKKKKSKGPPQPPPPLHILSAMYRQLISVIRTLYEMRGVSRKKRLEGWFLTKELAEIKNDNALYHDYLTDNIEDLENEIAKFKKLSQDIHDAIAKVVAARIAKLQKLQEQYEAQIGELEKELQVVRTQLLEFESMMIELAGMHAKIEELLKEIEVAKFEAELKKRHLTNQFLEERSRLHNHLEAQLLNLIQFCRQYLMPILWNFMQKLLRDNLCLRWKLTRSDEQNIALIEKREEMMRLRKNLALEKPYWDMDWTFFKLSELEAARKRKKKKVRGAVEVKVSGFGDLSAAQTQTGDGSTIEAVARLIPSSQLGKDFNRFLIQRLTAAKEAQERHEREKKREEKRFLKQILDAAQAMKDRNETFDGSEFKEMGVIVGEDDEGWEDVDDEETPPNNYYGEQVDEGEHFPFA